MLNLKGNLLLIKTYLYLFEENSKYLQDDLQVIQTVN